MKKGWKYEKLRDVTEKCTNIKWQNIPSTQECYYIDLSCVNRDIKQIENPQTINSANAPSRAKQIIREGDVLFGTTRPTLQRYCLINDLYDGQICSTGFCVLRPKRNIIHPKYLYYIFSTTDFYKYIEPLQSGANYPAVTDGDVKDYVAPIPSLSEQERIVAFLDAEFEKIDQLKANAAAQLQAAKDLVQKILSETMEKAILKGNVVSLGDVCFIARGGSPRPINKFLTTDVNGVNWIKIGDTEKGGKYINSCREKIIPEGVKRSRMVHKGDFLLTNSMSFGRPYITNIDGCIHDGWLVISPHEGTFDKDYLYYILSSSSIYKQFSIIASGSTVSNLNIDKVVSTKVPLLSIEEQKKLAAQLEDISDKIIVLQENYDNTLTLCNDLKQALLKSIFE